MEHTKLRRQRHQSEYRVYREYEQQYARSEFICTVDPVANTGPPPQNADGDPMEIIIINVSRD